MKRYIGGFKKEQDVKSNYYKLTTTTVTSNEWNYLINSTIVTNDNHQMINSPFFCNSKLVEDVLFKIEKPNPKYIGGYKRLQQ